MKILDDIHLLLCFLFISQCFQRTGRILRVCPDLVLSRSAKMPRERHYGIFGRCFCYNICFCSSINAELHRLPFSFNLPKHGLSHIALRIVLPSSSELNISSFRTPLTFANDMQNALKWSFLMQLRQVASKAGLLSIMMPHPEHFAFSQLDFRKSLVISVPAVFRLHFLSSFLMISDSCFLTASSRHTCRQPCLGSRLHPAEVFQ